MSELPSREALLRVSPFTSIPQLWVDLHDPDMTVSIEVIEPGRLIDRNAINYEAAETELHHTVFMLDRDDYRANPVDAARSIVDAALGIGDNVTGEDYDDLPRYLADVLLPIAMAYRAGELKTEAEWREAVIGGQDE